MFGAIIYREHSNREPEPGEEWLCETWACPSWMQCRHHIGRSYEYAAMLEARNGMPACLRIDLAPFAKQCHHFELDRPREWLKGWCSPMGGSSICPGCAAPECPNQVGGVVPFAMTTTIAGGR